MAESYTCSPEYREGIRRVGPGSAFLYSSIFDPRLIHGPDCPGRRDAEDAGVSGPMPGTLLVIAGPNGSGKSSLVNGTGLAARSGRIINPDNYARGLAGDLPDTAGRYLVAVRTCETIRDTLLELGEPFGFETVASRRDKLDLVRRAKEQGYYIDLIFVTAGSPEICCQRIRKRVESGGHDVPREKVFPDSSAPWASCRSISPLPIMQRCGTTAAIRSSRS